MRTGRLEIAGKYIDLPVLTEAEKGATGCPPAEGSFIYNDDTKCVEFYNGTEWVPVCGATGIQGATGLSGITGIQGLQGDTGIQGLGGETGPGGVTGTLGTDGITGAQGVTGLGVTGPQGITGLAGGCHMQFSWAETATHAVNTVYRIHNGTLSQQGYIMPMSGRIKAFGYTVDVVPTVAGTGERVTLQINSSDNTALTQDILNTSPRKGTQLGLNVPFNANDTITFISRNIPATTFGSSNDTVLLVIVEYDDCGGALGSTGLQGPTGLQGLTGAGIQGGTGVQGEQGLTGVQGETGVGLQGYTGTIGSTGFRGVTGPTAIAENLEVVQARRTTDYTLTSAWADLTFDTTDVETAPSKLEHDNTNTERILIKQTGLYELFYNVTTEVTSLGSHEFRVTLDGVTVLPGSPSTTIDANDTDDVGADFVYEFASPGYITLQSRTSGAAVAKADTHLTVVRLNGVEGKQGETGLQGLTGPAGGPQGATGVQGPQAVYGSEYEDSESLGVSTSTSTSFSNKLTLVTASKPIGRYIIEWSYGWNHNSTTTDFLARVVVDGTEYVYHQQEPKDAGGSWSTTGTNQRYRASGHILLDFASATTHTIEIDYSTTSTANASSIWDTRAIIHRVS